MAISFFYSHCELLTHLLYTHTHVTPVLSVSPATGAAPAVRVATVHRRGAEDGGNKQAVESQERRQE